MQLVAVVVGAVNGQSLEALLGVGVRLVRVGDFLHPGRLAGREHGDVQELAHPGEGVRRAVVEAALVQEAELKAHELGHGLALHVRLEMLLAKVVEALVVRQDV